MPSSPACRARSGEARDLFGGRAGDAGGGEVGFIEAGQHRHRDDLGLRSARRALAASIIARPPAAWTVSIAGSSGASASTALATVLGMSWSLRSRKIGRPCSAMRQHAVRAVGAEEFEAELHAAGEAADGLARAPRARSMSGVSMATKIGLHSTGSSSSAGGLGGSRRRRGCAPSLRSAGRAPDPRAHDQPGRQEAEQEGDQQQHRNLDVGLDVAPQVERDVRPVAAREQGDDHREQHPEQGLQKLHGRSGGALGERRGKASKRVRRAAESLRRKRASAR